MFLIDKAEISKYQILIVNTERRGEPWLASQEAGEAGQPVRLRLSQDRRALDTGRRSGEDTVQPSGMPKDYFEVVEEPEEVVSESERQAKVIEFVYQVGLGSFVRIDLH